MTPEVTIQITISLITLILSALGSYFAAYLGVAKGLVVAQNDIKWLQNQRIEDKNNHDQFRHDILERVSKLEAVNYRRSGGHGD